MRFHREVAEGTEIQSPKAWLSTVTTRLAIKDVRLRIVPIKTRRGGNLQ